MADQQPRSAVEDAACGHDAQAPYESLVCPLKWHGGVYNEMCHLIPVRERPRIFCGDCIDVGAELHHDGIRGERALA